MKRTLKLDFFGYCKIIAIDNKKSTPGGNRTHGLRHIRPLLHH